MNKLANEYTLIANDDKTAAILEQLKITNNSYYERRRQSGDLKAFGIMPDEVKEVIIKKEIKE